MKKRTILFLCTGDICRSPMAVFYAKTKITEKLTEQLEVRGAGVMTVSSLLPAPETAIVMKEDGIDVTPHRSTKLTKELIKKADLILGMTPFHVQMAKRISDLAKSKTFLFMEYVEDNPRQYQIADPMGGTLETFKITYKNIKKAIEKLIAMEAQGIYQKKSSFSKEKNAKSGTQKTRKRGRPRKSESQASDKKDEKTKAKTDSSKKKAKAEAKVTKKKTAKKTAEKPKKTKTASKLASKKKKTAKKVASKKTKTSAKKTAKKVAKSTKKPTKKKTAAKKKSSKKKK